jgi:hypothetical protein
MDAVDEYSALVSSVYDAALDFERGRLRLSAWLARLMDRRLCWEKQTL